MHCWSRPKLTILKESSKAINEAIVYLLMDILTLHGCFEMNNELCLPISNVLREQDVAV